MLIWAGQIDVLFLWPLDVLSLGVEVVIDLCCWVLGKDGVSP
jgi:hypothetical protein